MRLIEVAAGIIWRGGRFLAAQRPTDKPLEGYWEFPGGKLEARETPSEALARELAEAILRTDPNRWWYGQVEKDWWIHHQDPAQS